MLRRQRTRPQVVLPSAGHDNGDGGLGLRCGRYFLPKLAGIRNATKGLLL